jgi:pimeloyl-ACP methyl ester carboxylesterase
MAVVSPTSDQKSTIVRLFAAPPSVRGAFRVLEHTAPRLGARWAERIWFTLPRHRPRAGSRTAHSGPGQRFTVDVGGNQIVGESWGTGPVVYLMHGWAGHRGQFAAFVAPLTAHGYRVVAFDAPSHGASAPGAFGPRSSSIPEFAAALTAVTAAHGPARAVIAHSLGCTAAAVALRQGLAAERVVLLAPLASPLSFAGQFAAALGFGDRTYRRLIRRVERRVGAPMHHFDVPALGRTATMPPTLIIHDQDDNSTPSSDGAAIAAAWAGARLQLTTGLGHQRLLSSPEVVADVADFVAG